jgi:hypothetical protein
MNFTKVFIFLTILTICMVYITYTKRNYTYCIYAAKYGDYMVSEHNIEEYKNTCKNILQYSDHSLIKLILTFFYEREPYEVSEEMRNNIQSWINTQNIYTLKMEIRIMKLCHILLYFLVLYVLLQLIPNLIFKIVIYFAQNIFQIIMIVLVIEAILNLYFGVSLDIAKIFILTKGLLEKYISPFFNK